MKTAVKETQTTSSVTESICHRLRAEARGNMVSGNTPELVC